MSDLDVQRWGDTQMLSLTALPGESNLVRPSKQMLWLHWQRPLLWKLLLSLTPNLLPGENVTFLVTVTLFIGNGQASFQVPQVFTFAPVAGVYSPQVIFLDVPAENVQLSFTVTIMGGGQPNVTTGQSFTVAASGAPFTEPRVGADLRDLFLASLPPRADALPDGSHDPSQRWMPPGFDDGEVRYRR